MKVRRVAIVGAGPVGLEVALRARHEGHEVVVFEAGTVGEHFRRYGSVPLFTPFRMNASELGRERLFAAGVELPGEDDTLSADELRTRYLLPLSRLPELSGAVHEGARVAAIARQGFTKGHAAGPGDASRAERPFLLRVESSDSAGRIDRGGPIDGEGPIEGEGRLERADVVIDAS